MSGMLNFDEYLDSVPSVKNASRAPAGKQDVQIPYRSEIDMKMGKDTGVKGKLKKGVSGGASVSISISDLEHEFQLEQLADKYAAQKNVKKDYLRELMDRHSDQLEGVKSQVNLRPLAMYIDAQTGSNFANSMTRPAFVKKRLEQANKLRGAIDRVGLSVKEDDKKLLKEIIDIQNKRDRVKYQMANSAAALLAKMNGGQGGGTKEKMLTAGELKRLNEIHLGINTMRKIVGAIEEKKHLLGMNKAYLDIPGLDQKTADEIAKMFGMGEITKEARDRALLKKDILMYVQTAGKTLEGGVLREGDWVKYTKMLGNEMDNPLVLQQVAKGLMNQFKQGYNTTLQNFKLVHRDTGDLRPMIIKRSSSGRKSKGVKKGLGEYTDKDVSKMSRKQKLQMLMQG